MNSRYSGKIMFYIHFMLLSMLCWIYAVECMEVIPERANLTYSNPKYLYPNETINVRRYSRKSRYYINVLGTNKQTWANNITFTLGISQLLHNEFRPSFVTMSHKLCDLINKEPFVGGALRNAGLVCPMPPGYYGLANITAPTEHFPNVFPFEKGRIDITLTITDTKEPVLKLFIVASFKQRIKKT